MTMSRRRLAFGRLASIPVSEHAAIRRFGGFYFDFSMGVYCWVDPATRAVTTWASFNDMLTSIGSITSSEKHIWDATGHLTIVNANTPACPAYTSAGTPIGIAVETAPATNFLTYSEDFTQAAWTATGVTLASNSSTSPRQDTTASTITEDGSTGNHCLTQSVTGQDGHTTLSYVAAGFVKRDVGTPNAVIKVDDGSGNGLVCVFNLDTGEMTVTGLGTPFTYKRAWFDTAGVTGYVRIALTFIKPAATTVNFSLGLASGTDISYAGDGTSSLIVWGAELKQHSGGVLSQTETHPSSYVRTTSAAVTRAADVIALSMPTELQGATTYSMHVQARIPKSAADGACVFAALCSDDNAQRLYIGQSGASFGSQLEAIITGTTSRSLITSPANHFDEAIGFAAVFETKNFWAQNTFQGSTTSGLATVTNVALTTVRLGTYDPTSNVVGCHTSVMSLAIFPISMRRTLMQKLLFDTLTANPDRVTGPNYMTQDMLADVAPAVADGFEVIRGPAGIEAPDYLPGSVYYVGQLGGGVQNSTSTTAKFAYLQWTNRCNSLVPVHFTGTISGTTLIVTETDGPIGSGQILLGAAPGTYITDTPAKGGPGTYTVNISQTISTPTVFTQPANLASFAYNSIPGAGIILADKSVASLQLTTFDRCDALTLAGALYVNNYDDRNASPPPTGQWYNAYLQPIEAIFGPVTVDQPGSRVVTYAYAKANKETLFPNRAVAGNNTFAYATDLFVLPDDKFFTGTAQVWGSLADFEMTDFRFASRLTPLVQQLALIHHNADTPTKYGIMADPMISSGKKTGLSGIGIPGKTFNCDVDNLGAIASAVDFFNVLVQQPPPVGYTFETALALYYAAFGTPGVDFDPSTIGIGFVMGVWPGGTSKDDAQTVHDFIVANGLGGIQTGPTKGQRNRWTVQKWLTCLGLPT